jgi:hypothetical protein
MAFCTKCGAQVQGPFCGSCGAAASAPDAPAQGAPASPAPPPASPSPSTAAATKTSPLVWVLAGCGGLIVLAAIVAGLALHFIANKAGQFARKVERNPTLAITELMAAHNPDVDVVSVDEGKGRITVRDKKTGKTLTMNFADAQKGKFVFEQDGQKVAVQAHGDGSTSSLEVKSGEGSMTMGTGAEKLPEWIPAYPGSAPQGTFSMHNAKEESGSFQFSSADSIDRVVRYYEDAFKKTGMKVSTNSMQTDGKTGLTIVTADEANQKRKAMITVAASPEGSSVGITFTAKQ